jgi:regulator of sigma E protease
MEFFLSTLLASSPVVALQSAGSSGGGFVLAVLTMILALTLIITVHEFGHWIVARIFGFKTPVFSIGFGPRKWSYIIGNFWNTEFRLSPILLGGYVSIPELQDETTINDAAKDAGIDPADIKYFPVWQRICVSAAGVFFNIVSAGFLIFALLFFWGTPSMNITGTYIKALAPGLSKARDAGLQAGDKLVSADGVKIVAPKDLVGVFSSHKRAPVVLEVDRTGQAVTVTVVPGIDGRIGVNLGVEGSRVYEDVPFGTAVSQSVSKTGDLIVLTFKGLGMMAHIVDRPPELTDADMEVRGLVGIVQMGADALVQGLYDFIWFLVFISINVAVLNILPFPVLDGGHIVFALVEKFRGEPIRLEIKAALFNVFIFLLLGLMVLGLFNDMRHIVGG